MHEGVLLGAALGLCVASSGLACGSSSSTPQGTHGSSSSSSSGGGSGGEGLDGGVRMIPGFTGVVSCSQPVDAGAGDVFGHCELSMPVSGGLSGTINVPEVAVICGSSGSTSGTGVGEIDWSTAIGQGTTVGATVFFDNGLPLDMTGTFPAHVEIDESSSGGGMLQWVTPQGGCSIVIAGSECVSSPGKGVDGGPQYARILSGTGTCSQPAAPQSGTSGAPITIGTFAFLEAVGP
ncbi:MAG TPA: hypothetical protein VF765_19140 [Polyangiaceae bacterium]